MPKPRKAPPAASVLPPAGGEDTATPAPPATLHITPWTLPAKQVLHRVHQDLYKADQFNPGLKGNARFSPIRDAKGDSIQTLYAAATFDAAAMESVFHDVSHAPGFKHYDKRKLEGQLHSEVKVKRELKLAAASHCASWVCSASSSSTPKRTSTRQRAAGQRPSTPSIRTSRGCPGSLARTTRLAR